MKPKNHTPDEKRDLIGEVFDHLANNITTGLTIAELSDKTLRPAPAIRHAIRNARLTLAANGDTLFIVADPQGHCQPWIYRLVDGAVVINAEDSKWAANRIDDAQSRLRIINAGMTVAVSATKSHTLLGKKARVLQMHLGYLLDVLDHEDLAEQVRVKKDEDE